MPLNRSRRLTFIAVPILILALVTGLYFSRKAQTNPVTGQQQHISLTTEQEIAWGIESAPQLAVRFGGICRDEAANKKLKMIGRKLVASSDIAKSPYQFDFHLLADSISVETFAFPGGQIFVTAGLFKKLKTDEKIAVILSHQIGHVIGRHASARLFKVSIFEEIKKPDTILVADFPPRLIMEYLSEFISLEYNTAEENEADKLGLNSFVRAGFHSNSFLPDFPELKSNIEKSKMFPQKHRNFLNRKEKLTFLQKEDS